MFITSPKELQLVNVDYTVVFEGTRKHHVVIAEAINPFTLHVIIPGLYAQRNYCRKSTCLFVYPPYLFLAALPTCTIPVLGMHWNLVQDVRPEPEIFLASFISEVKLCPSLDLITGSS